MMRRFLQDLGNVNKLNLVSMESVDCVNTEESKKGEFLAKKPNMKNIKDYFPMALLAALLYWF